MPKISLPANQSEIHNGVEFIEQTIRKYRFKNKEVMKTLLVAEESMVRLIGKAEENVQMQISIRYRYGTAEITISAAGAPLAAEEPQIDLSVGDMGHDSEETIRSILLQAFSNKMTYTRKGEYNFIKITAGVRERVFLYRTMVAMAAGLAVAFLLSVILPHAAVEALADNFLYPLQTIFLNALQLVTAPTVFFCILSNVSRYASFSDPGRVSRKIITGYLLTSIFAVLIGMFIFELLQPGTWVDGILAPYIGETQNVDFGNSILELIINIVPTNIVAPFSDTNAMQLLFIAFLGGIVLGGTGRYTRELRTAADALDSFFSATAGIVSNAIPVMTFFSTILCVAYFDFTSLNIGLEVFGVTVLGLAMMLAGYTMLVFASRLNPITFLRKYAPNVVNTFLGGSSIHAIPETMRVCEKKFGVSPKVFSFSIPFGAIGNLDGNCVYLTIAGLYMARLYGVSFFGRELVSIIFVVVLLSVGAPIVPGTVMVTLTMLMNTMGISPVGMSFIIGINVIVEMLLTVCNTIGDVAITLVIARTEGLLDLNVYREKPAESVHGK